MEMDCVRRAIPRPGGLIVEVREAVSAAQSKTRVRSSDRKVTVRVLTATTVGGGDSWDPGADTQQGCQGPGKRGLLRCLLWPPQPSTGRLPSHPHLWSPAGGFRPQAPRYLL